MRRFGPPPTADELEQLARRVMECLPAPFAEHVRTVVLMVEEFADEATLRDLGLEDPFELTGLYVGHPLTEKSIGDSGTLPDKVILYRRPIIDEWVTDGEELEHLVSHVLIHELGHHFGFSDGDMHLLEDQVR